jgi:hypothetical protein
MSSIKLFAIETGATEWVMAKTKEEAFRHLQNIVDLDEGDMEKVQIDEVSPEKMETLKFTDECSGRKTTFTEEFSRSLREEKMPYFMASSEY